MGLDASEPKLVKMTPVRKTNTGNETQDRRNKRKSTDMGPKGVSSIEDEITKMDKLARINASARYELLNAN